MDNTVYVKKTGGVFKIYAKYFGMDSPAGPRMMRGGEFPAIEFSHTSMRKAIADAEKLQEYLNNKDRSKKCKRR